MAQGATARVVKREEVSNKFVARSASSKPKKAIIPSATGQLTESERNQLIEENIDLGYRLAWKFLHHWRIRLFEDEVRSIVGLALCEAALRFNRDFKTSFRTFLFYHLRGCLLKEISDKIKQSHSRRSLVAALIEGDDDRKAVETEDLSFVERFTPEAALQEKQTSKVCWEATQQLDELEQQVLLRHFVEEDSLNQIAENLGYCRCHISRVKHKALEKMERMLRPVVQPEETEAQKAAAMSRLTELRRYTGGRGRRKPGETKTAQTRVERQKVAA